MIIRKQAFNVFLEQSSNHISDIHMNGSLTFILFLTAVIVVYSSLNTYFILKHRNFVTLKTLPLLLVRLLLVTIILTPVATFYFSWQGPTIPATLTSLTGYSWLAFLFLFLMIVLLVAKVAVFRRLLAKDYWLHLVFQRFQILN